MNVCWTFATSLLSTLHCLSITQQTDEGDETQANALLSYCEPVREWHTFYISALCCALSWWAVGNPCQEPWPHHSDQNKIVGVTVSALLTSNSHVIQQSNMTVGCYPMTTYKRTYNNVVRSGSLPSILPGRLFLSCVDRFLLAFLK